MGVGGIEMCVLLFVLGTLPFAVGHIQNRIMMVKSHSVFPFMLMGLLFLSFWGIVAFIFQNRMKNVKRKWKL